MGRKSRVCGPTRRARGAHESVRSNLDGDHGPIFVDAERESFLLTFVDHLTKYVEAYPIPDQTAESCARIYVTQIISRHGTGSQLITDQRRGFMSTFFQETCKLLGVRTTRTTSFHPTANRVIERWHRSLHMGLSHYVNSANTNWDTLVPLFLMAYRTTPNTVTGYSPFFLLHGREMEIPGYNALKARVLTENPDLNRRLESLKANLKTAYKLEAEANQKTQQANKRLYDRKAKERHFNIGDMVYLYRPAIKHGLTLKIPSAVGSPYQITIKTSELNYEILGQDGRTQVLRVKHLKKAYGSNQWKPKTGQRTVKKTPRELAKCTELSDKEEEPKLGSFPSAVTDFPADTCEREPPPYQTPRSPDHTQPETDTLSPQHEDQNYRPPETPGSRREIQSMQDAPPLTRSQARVMSQSSVNQ